MSLMATDKSARGELEYSKQHTGVFSSLHRSALLTDSWIWISISTTQPHGLALAGPVLHKKGLALASANAVG